MHVQRWAADLQCLRDGVDQRLPVDDVLEPAELADDQPRERHAVAVGVHVGLKLAELLEQHVGQLSLQRVHLQEHAHQGVLDPVTGGCGCTVAHSHGRQCLPQAGGVLPRVSETLDQLVASVVALHRALQVLPELERVGGKLVRPGTEGHSRFLELGEHFGLVGRLGWWRWLCGPVCVPLSRARETFGHGSQTNTVTRARSPLRQVAPALTPVWWL